jgi:hypothetical protein
VSQLGQQELLTLSPSRQIIVPKGHTAWWGVDPSTKRVAIASVWGGPAHCQRWAAMASFPTVEGAPRLSVIYEMTREKVRALADQLPWPGLVLVEQPGGSQRNWPLFYAVGVTIMAVHDGLREATGTAVKIETMVPDRWKKLACGRGHIYKPKKTETHEYGVLTWARENGYAGSSWDEADAMGLAEAARREVALEVR